MNWLEIPFLVDEYQKAMEMCKEDEYFECRTFEACMKTKVTRAVHVWTVADWERKILIQDMLDSAMDER